MFPLVQLQTAFGVQEWLILKPYHTLHIFSFFHLYNTDDSGKEGNCYRCLNFTYLQRKQILVVLFRLETNLFNILGQI
jgi:hypothetical protein